MSANIQKQNEVASNCPCIAIPRHVLEVPQGLKPYRPTQPFLPTMSKLRTFIVEDNPVILNNLIATLEELSDVEVVGSVGSEHEAVSQLQNCVGQVDLVIVDVFLTSGSGLGVLRSTQNLNLSARRVVLSNYATVDMRRRCLELGADRVFDKSSELEELIAYCDNAAQC